MFPAKSSTWRRGASNNVSSAAPHSTSSTTLLNAPGLRRVCATRHGIVRVLPRVRTPGHRKCPVCEEIARWHAPGLAPLAGECDACAGPSSGPSGGSGRRCGSRTPGDRRRAGRRLQATAALGTCRACGRRPPGRLSATPANRVPAHRRGRAVGPLQPHSAPVARRLPPSRPPPGRSPLRRSPARLWEPRPARPGR